MARPILIGIAASLLTVPAVAQDSTSREVPGAAAALAGSFAVPRTTSAEAARRLVELLDQLCSSRRARDQRRCDAAWREINAGYAQLQARRRAAAGSQ